MLDINALTHNLFNRIRPQIDFKDSPGFHGRKRGLAMLHLAGTDWIIPFTPFWFSTLNFCAYSQRFRIYKMCFID